MRATEAPPADARTGWLGVAGLASIGAGAIHAAAIGGHSEHRQAVWTFTIVAAFQIGIGVLALVKPGRIVGVVLAVGNAALIGGWVIAKSAGLGFIEGMGEAESVQAADLLAAALAALALAASVAALFRITVGTRTNGPAYAICGVVVALIAVPAMVATGGHSHAGGHGDGHDHGGAEAFVPPEPFDGTLPVNLAGVPGVSEQEQREAEELVTRTIELLPQFNLENLEDLNELGYYSIGDAGTGHEHYINWSYIDDDKILDPDYPESLVVQEYEGKRQVVAAMFMLNSGTPLSEVPPIGGPLIQWHVHDDLCFTDDPVAPRVAGLRELKGECPNGLVARGDTPMIHVWIIPHKCGPFAALDGIGGGQVAEGEEHMCNHVHGDPLGST